MENKALDLNEPPVEDGIVQFVMLQKDSKQICRTRCCNLPFQVSTHWTISEFRQSSVYWKLDLPCCQLYPESENFRQKSEWGNFLYFLWKNNVVAIVKSESRNFYLLAPDECPEFTHLVVLYQTKKENLTSDDREIGTSGEIINEHRNSASQSLCQKPCKNGRGLRTEHAVQKNFVRTDPSYLKTLSQTHAGWAFGAIAELVDNSRDANAARLEISVEYLYSKKEGKKIPVLSVVDDGHGMSHSEIVRMLSFGHKQTDEEDPDHIGRFGIGFKTGAMKLGRDVAVLTQTLESRSVALLSQSYNEQKENLEIPIVSYCKQGHYMEVDLSIQSEALANFYLNAIKDFSPFNEYSIGERLGLFGEMGTGTQIFIWNLDEWGSDYTLEWVGGGKTVKSASHQSQGDILIRSRRLRSRPGQISHKVPLDYSLQAYLEVIFLDPRMKIYVQGSLVKSRPLAKSLNKTVLAKGNIMGKPIQLTLGRSKIEWERMNCGIFLYWHGRLIEAYKRVGGMVHNADMGRGVLGVVDVSSLMDNGNGQVWVLNNKQGFQDCEAYAKLEGWLGMKTDEYWDENFDTVNLVQGQGDDSYKPDHEWVQCNKCRKWRILSAGFNSENLPPEWFCHMIPFNGKCETPEQQLGRGVITVATKRARCDSEVALISYEEGLSKKAKNNSTVCNTRTKQSASNSPMKVKNTCQDDSGEDSTQTEDDNSLPKLRRLRRAPPRSCKPL